MWRLHVKKLLLTILALSIVNCTDIHNMYDGLMIDPNLLLEYNTILQHNAQGVCGSTVISSEKKTTCVITAAHCISMEKQSIEINNGNTYDVILIDMNSSTSDLALLCTNEEMPIQNFSSVSSGEPEITEDIWVVGYGAREKDVVTRGIVSKINTEGHYERPMNLLDCTIWYGNSGGGIFNKYGELVGVVSQFGPQFDTPSYHGPETGWIYGCRIREIKALLNMIKEKD